ncbi:MAG: hypothetical protein ACFCBV_04270 [Phycisphaerales bacterium]
MAEVTAYLLAPAGAMDIDRGVRHLQTDGWSLTGKMWELYSTEDHPVPLSNDRVPKVWKRFAHTSDRSGIQGAALRDGIDLSICTFTANGVSSVELGWKPRVPPVAPDATVEGFLLPLAERAGAWIVMLLGTDPWWLPGLFRLENGMIRLCPDPEERSELLEKPPSLFVHETKLRMVDSSVFRPTRHYGSWAACELVL